jgi:preprotein translocase subunit SecF
MHGGPRFGIEFTGGAMVQVAFNKDVHIDELRSSIKGAVEGTPVVQAVLGKDREFIVVMEKTSDDMGGIQKVVKSTLEKSFGAGSVEITQTKMIGPKVGNDLKQKGLLAVGIALVCMLIYIGFRFQFDFGLGAVVATFHDVLLMVGYFSLMNKEFDLTFVAALLTIVGFSMNDTVVVFDRIRELMNRLGGKASVEEIMNRSVNETLSRTILTSLTVVICIVVLLALGGPAVHDFAVALMVGVVSGTYSSIYIASPVVLAVRNYQAKKAKQAAASA